jgi:hypothetical protein
MISENRLYPKWIRGLAIPGILIMTFLFTTCREHVIPAPFSSREVFAVAFPAELPPSEVGKVFSKYGIDSLITEDNLLIPMTDFVRLRYLPLSELTSRIQDDDPRHTPLSSLLRSSFTTIGDDAPWRIWYVPLVSSSVYRAIQNAFTEIGSDWAWDAQPPSPALRFLWTIWLGWTIWLLSSKQVKDRLYHGALIFAWLPLIFFQNVPAAALMVVGQGVSAVLGITALANGRRQSLASNHLCRLLSNLAPFLLSMLVLVVIELELLIPTALSMVIVILLVVYRNSVLNILNGRRMHRFPPFRLILDDSIKFRANRLGLLAVIPLTMIAIVLIVVPHRADESIAHHLAFKVEADQNLHTPDYASLIRSHTVYQEALAWGRLGDASWMTDSYSRPYRFKILENRIVRAEMDHGINTESFQNSIELDKEMKRILAHTKGGTPMVVSSGDLPVMRPIQLDSMGVVFYIMAIAPFCILGLQRVGQSRRRTIASYTNRQVA